MVENNLFPFYSEFEYEAGVDEVGRGCLAGPVVAAAVILPKECSISGLNDSKKLSSKIRNELVIQIKEQAIAWAIAEIDNLVIDEVNILNASFLAMHKAINQLDTKPEFLIIDGNRFLKHDIPHKCIIKGDSKYMSIAAASILAKTYRDDLMVELAKKHPFYDWSSNKGYPTKKHRKGIELHGTTDLHRMTFQLLSKTFPLFDV